MQLLSRSSLSRLMGLSVALIMIPVLASCQGNTEPEAEIAPETEAPVAAETKTGSESAAEPASETIVDVAIANGSFETLVAAVQAADLADTLSSDGPFTVFAPTDEAFAALPEGVLEALLLPENKETLSQILTYHVL